MNKHNKWVQILIYSLGELLTLLTLYFIAWCIADNNSLNKPFIYNLILIPVFFTVIMFSIKIYSILDKENNG
jgi:ABC-type spermidine/putrescine transport system permease subunit I